MWGGGVQGALEGVGICGGHVGCAWSVRVWGKGDVWFLGISEV